MRKIAVLYIISATIGGPNKISRPKEAAKSSAAFLADPVIFSRIFYTFFAAQSVIITYNFSVAAVNKVISPSFAYNEHRDSR